MTIKYRINWKAIETDATGHGEPVFNSRETAQRNADTLNTQNSGVATHWVEAIAVAVEEED